MVPRLVASFCPLYFALACAPPSVPLPVDPSGTTSAASSDGFETSGDATGSIDSTSGADSGDGGSTGEEPPTSCVGPEMLDAPEPVPLDDGTRAVPIDVLSVEATFTIVPDDTTARFSATMAFRVGEVGGRPLFDLVAEDLSARLDDEPIDAGDLEVMALGDDATASVRVLAQSLEPCTEHTLSVEIHEDVFGTTFINGGFHLWTGFSDLQPRGYLERYVPTNLVFDEFDFDLEVVIDSPIPHLLYADRAEESSLNHWRLQLPGISSLSPRIEIAPRDAVLVEEHLLTSAVGDTPVFVYLDADDGALGPGAAWLLQNRYEAFSAAYGPVPFPSIGASIDGFTSSMEYDGHFNATPESLAHELHHMWWGRGRKPATEADGWIDEAWTEWVTGEDLPQSAPLNFEAPPVVLASTDPFARVTPQDAYTVGQQLFAGIADVVGPGALGAMMVDYWHADPGGRLRTAELERHLHCASGEGVVRRAFHRFVYGLPGEPPDVPDDYCP